LCARARAGAVRRSTSTGWYKLSNGRYAPKAVVPAPRLTAALVKRLKTEPWLRLRYFWLAYHQDSTRSSFVDQLGRKARSFFGHAPGCRTKM
jgi:hypothetical protein